MSPISLLKSVAGRNRGDAFDCDDAFLRKPFKEVINAALRVGLDQILAPPAAKSYRTKSRPLGLRQGFSYDNISELLARAEGEDHS